MQTGSEARHLNLPNSLSILRIASTPVLLVMLISPGRTLGLAAAIVFLLVCLTDWLDGYIARRTGVVTSLGKILDPLADKLLIVTAFIMLIPLGRIPAWVVALIVGREIAVTGLRSIAVNIGVVIQASRLGKYKTVFQIAAITPLIIHHRFFGVDFHAVGTALLIAAFVLTMWSGIDYFVRFFMAAPQRD